MSKKHVELPSEYNHLHSAVLSGVIYIDDNYTGNADVVIIPLSEVFNNG